MVSLEDMESVLRAILEMNRPQVEYENMCWTFPPGLTEPRGHCGICSLCRDPEFIRELFQKTFHQLGMWNDLKAWARNGCPLCKHIEQDFLKQLVSYCLWTDCWHWQDSLGWWWSLPWQCGVRSKVGIEKERQRHQWSKRKWWHSCLSRPKWFESHSRN